MPGMSRNRTKRDVPRAQDARTQRPPQMGRGVPREGPMMHQKVGPAHERIIEPSKRPDRDTVIDSDDICNLRIDLAILDSRTFLERYCT